MVLVSHGLDLHDLGILLNEDVVEHAVLLHA
jgi:hypothetical protein